MDGLVYIIVPVYNVEKYLNRCLDSIFNQTYKNIFVIAINDGSTDNSLTILNDYKKKYKNIKIIDKPNGGLSSARNAGLDAINNYDSNTYITFVDSDDYISLDYIETLMTIMKNNNCDIVCSEHIWFDSDYYEETHFNDSYSFVIVDKVEACRRLFDGTTQSHIPTKLYKSYIWKNTRFDTLTKFMEDQRLTFKLFYLTHGVGFINYPGYYYFNNSSSLVRTKLNNNKILDALDGYFEAVKYPYEKKDLAILKKSAHDCFAAAYLMLFPRYKKKSATKEESLRINFYTKYIKKEKIIKMAVFKSRKNRLKKILYLMFPCAYPYIYKLLVKTFN